MKTKQERKDDSVKRIELLKQETIFKYAADISFNEDLSLYDVMMEHFVKGDLDSVFLTDVCDDMSKAEREELFQLARKYYGLCFANGDVDYWLDSIEDTVISDYDLIAYSILDSYDYLLSLAKVGGEKLLQRITSIRDNSEFKDSAIIEMFRNTFIDDRALTAVLEDINSGTYDMFTNEQLGILLTYPEGTLYSYRDGRVVITDPLVLASRMYNDYNKEITDDLIGEIDENNYYEVFELVKNFFQDDGFDFENAVIDLSSRYRDYLRKSNTIFNGEVKSVVYDGDGVLIQEAWDNGDSFLGGTYDTPYTGGSK